MLVEVAGEHGRDPAASVDMVQDTHARLTALFPLYDEAVALAAELFGVDWE